MWFDEEQTPVPLLCDYYLEGAAADEPSNLVLYGLDGDLPERGSLAGPTAVGQLHAGSTGTGMTVAARSIDEVAIPEWRVVFTAALPSAAAQRRDHQAGRRLAVNALAGQKGVFQVWVHTGPNNDLHSKLTAFQWMYLDANVNLLTPPGSSITLTERKSDSLTIRTTFALLGNFTWGFLSADQQNSAAKMHCTTAIAAEDQPSIEGAGGRAPNTYGTNASPDRTFVSLGVINESNSGHGSVYLLPNCILHEIGHTCNLGHGVAGTPNVMGATISGNPAMFDQLYVYNGGKSAWGAGFYQDDKGNWKVDGETATAENIMNMRAHCGIK